MINAENGVTLPKPTKKFASKNEGPSGVNLKGLVVNNAKNGLFLLTIKVFCAKLILAGYITGFWFTLEARSLRRAGIIMKGD